MTDAMALVQQYVMLSAPRDVDATENGPLDKLVSLSCQHELYGIMVIDAWEDLSIHVYG